MNVRFFAFGLMCASPWIYMACVVAIAGPGQVFAGFKMLPFVVLLWLKEQALMTRKERDLAASKDEPYWKMPFYIVGAFALVIGVALSGDALRQLLGDAVVAVFGGLIFIMLFIWDMKRAYLRAKRSA